MKKAIVLSAVVASSLFAFTDTNSDAIMDSWATKYAITSATADTDGDGLTNLQEFTMQTDPTLKTELQFVNTAKVSELANANWIEKYGEYWIVATSSSVIVFDKNWTQISMIGLGISSFHIEGTNLYGVTSNGTGKIINLLNPSSISLTTTVGGSKTITNSWYFYSSKGLYINNKFIQVGYKYKSNEFGQAVYKTVMLVYDASTPSTPVLLSEFELADGQVSNIYYSSLLLSDDSTLFLSNSNFGTKKAIDISDPVNPKFVDKSALSGKVGNLYYANNTVYNVTELSQYGLTLTSDYSTTTMNTNTSQSSLPNRNFAVDGTSIYVPTGSGLQQYILGPKIPEAISINADINFTKLSELPVGSKIVEFDYNGQSDKTNKYLNIYSFDTTAKSVNRKKYYLDGSLISDVNGKYTESYAGAGINIDIDGDYYVFVSSNSKLAKLKNGVAEYVDGEISIASDSEIVAKNNLRIFQVANIPTIMTSERVDITGNYAVVTSSSGARIFDISNLNGAKEVAKLDGNFNYAKVFGNKLVVANYGNYVNNAYQNNLKIYDLTNPAKPTLLSTTQIRADGYAYYFGLEVVDNTLYYAGRYNVNNSGKTYLSVVDITDGANPKILGNLDTTLDSSSYGGIKKDGNYLYIDSGYLHRIDISNPANMIVDSSFSGQQYGIKDILFYNGKRVSQGNYNIDVDGTQIASFEYDGSSRKNMAFKDNYLFVPRGYYGFDVFDLNTNAKVLSLDSNKSNENVTSMAIKDETLFVQDGSSLLAYSLKAYDKDFDGFPDTQDLYPNDATKQFTDSDSDGKIDKVNPNTTPSNTVYHDYMFDDDFNSLKLNGWQLNDFQLNLLNSDGTISVISDVKLTQLISGSVYANYYKLGFDSFDSLLVDTLYSISSTALDSSKTISNSSKEATPFVLSQNGTWTDKLTNDNIGSDARWFKYTPIQTGTYSLALLKLDDSSALIKTDESKEAKITITVYRQEITKEISKNYQNGWEYESIDGGYQYYKLTYGTKTLVRTYDFDPAQPELLTMAFEQNYQYSFSMGIENIDQYKYNIAVVAEDTLVYKEKITLDENGEAKVEFVTPRTSTYQFITNANALFTSELYMGTQLDASHKIDNWNNKFTDEAIGMKASNYTLMLKGKAGEKMDFLLGYSTSKKEVEPNNTYQSATPVEVYKEYSWSQGSATYTGLLDSTEADYFKVNPQANASNTTSFSVNLSFDTKYIKTTDKVNLYLYNASGDLVNKSVELMDKNSINFNFNEIGGTYFIRLTSTKTENLPYTLSFTGVNTPAQTQNELSFAKLYESYILTRSLDTSGLGTVVESNGDDAEFIILAGDGDNPTDTLYVGSQKLAQNFYNRLRFRGAKDDDIYFLNGTSDTIDLENDGIADNVVDDKNPTTASFYKTITDRSTSTKKGPLVIYMVDHGTKDSFKITTKNNKSEIVYDTKLKEAITTFQSTSGSRPVYVVIEACKSGSFVDTLTDANANIAVFTSSMPTELSYIDRFGNVAFSKFFADALLSGQTMEGAFNKSKEKLKSQGGVYELQNPMAFYGSDSLKGFQVGGDFAAADMELGSITDYFGKSSQSFNTSSDAKDINLFMTVGSTSGINRVWATVIPPNYQPPTIADNSFTIPDMTPYTVELKYDVDSKQYKGIYTPEAAYSGDYQIAYYVESSDGGVISQSVTMNGINIDSQIVEQNNKPVFSLSDSILDVILNQSGVVQISGFGEYSYEITNSNPNIVQATLNGNAIEFKGLDIGSVTITVTATNNGYTTSKQLSVTAKESDSTKKNILNIAEGWNLVSPMTTDSFDVTSFNATNVDTIWSYKSGKWSAYSTNSQTSSKLTANAIATLATVKAGEGTWIYAKQPFTITKVGTPYNFLGDNWSGKIGYGWSLVGSGEQTAPLNLYKKVQNYGGTLNSIWKYNNNKWFVHSENMFFIEKIKADALNGTSSVGGVLDGINAGEGFWIDVR